MFSNLFRLFYPNLCICCGTNLLKNEEIICTKCLCDMPRTNMHLQAHNAVEKHFWGKVDIEKGTSFFYFAKGSVFQKLLHQLKYKNNQQVGVVLGRYAAADMVLNDYFADVDIIIPVPLHPKKYHKRGYNQSECICKGLSEVLQKPYDTTHLIRIKENSTQTKKSVFERYTNTQGIFGVIKEQELIGKHLLIVDDVLTTGATLEGCLTELLKIQNVKVSVFTLAMA